MPVLRLWGLGYYIIYYISKKKKKLKKKTRYRKQKYDRVYPKSDCVFAFHIENFNDKQSAPGSWWEVEWDQPDSISSHTNLQRATDSSTGTSSKPSRDSMMDNYFILSYEKLAIYEPLFGSDARPDKPGTSRRGPTPAPATTGLATETAAAPPFYLPKSHESKQTAQNLR